MANGLNVVAVRVKDVAAEVVGVVLDDAPNPDTMEATRDTIETLEIIVRRWRNRREGL